MIRPEVPKLGNHSEKDKNREKVTKKESKRRGRREGGRGGLTLGEDEEEAD